MVCELLVVAFDEPRPFRDVAPTAAALEELGVAGFGWGVAWLEDEPGAGAVRVLKGLGRYRDEGHRNDGLLTTVSRRFIVHLRRPSRLSTVQLADTQPFVDDERLAWAHNGFLERAEELRDAFAGRLKGRADSEVGWEYFRDRLGEGMDVLEALQAVDERFGGKVNLACLSADGDLCIYSQNSTNRMWQFRLDGGEMAATDLHSDDSSLFDLVAPRATDRRLLAPGTAVRLAGPRAPDGEPARGRAA